MELTSSAEPLVRALVSSPLAPDAHQAIDTATAAQVCNGEAIKRVLSADVAGAAWFRSRQLLSQMVAGNELNSSMSNDWMRRPVFGISSRSLRSPPYLERSEVGELDVLSPPQRGD